MHRYFPIEEYETRWARVHDEIARRGFETAVVFGRAAARRIIAATFSISPTTMRSAAAWIR